MYKVTYASDSLDPNPTIKFFDFHHEWKIGFTKRFHCRVNGCGS
jgi:hypothetical protein